jgi:hypothetical protein
VNTIAKGLFVDEFSKVFKNVNCLLVPHYVEGLLAFKVHYLVFWVVHKGIDGEIVGLKACDIGDSIFCDIG